MTDNPASPPPGREAQAADLRTRYPGWHVWYVASAVTRTATWSAQPAGYPLHAADAEDLAVLVGAAELAPATVDLAAALARWQHRAEPDAEARHAANTAMDTLDAMLAVLHQLRARLVAEIRTADDGAAARVDQLLHRDTEGG